MVGDLIAEVARTHGIAISRDDPVIAVVLLNQLILRRYLEEAVAPVAAAIREATREAVGEIEQLAQAQARWLEQVSLKDRASFLEEQKALHQSRKVDLEALIEGQNTALRQVVMQTAALLRAKAQGVESRSTAGGSLQAVAAVAPRGRVIPWRWIYAGALMGTGATMALAVVALAHLGGQ